MGEISGALSKATNQLRYRRALRSLVRPSAADPRYHSAFGGLWTDRRDATEEVDRRLDAGAISTDEADTLRQWIAHGYVILERAVDPAVCDRLGDDLDRAFLEGDQRLVMYLGGDRTPRRLDAGPDIRHTLVLDVYVYYDSARQALFSQPIVRCLRWIFRPQPTPVSEPHVRERV
jgi:hypothetical protein